MDDQHILVVDDEERITRFVGWYLEAEGYGVEVAGQGMEALEKARQRDFALIILDLMLPGLDGWEVCRQIRQRSRVPILMLTARDAAADRILGLELGADDYLTKPFSPRELVLRVNAILKRVEERDAAQRRLQVTQERLLQSERLALIGQMASGLVHELKNPLGGIIGAASTIRDHCAELPPQQTQEFAAAIAEEGWRLKNTIDEVRNHARPSSLPLNSPQSFDCAQDRLGGGRSACQVADLIAEIDRLLRFDPRFRTVQLTRHLNPEAVAYCNRDQIKQVLLNLLNNAAEAIDHAEGRVEVAVRQEGGQVIVQVSDNGCGIPEEHLDRIWEPFFTTKGQAGTGLGLDLCRQIIEAHGGMMAVESQAGQGTAFTVTLPGVERFSEGVSPSAWN